MDWKPLMHAVRVCHEAQEILSEHRITFPRPEAELLLRIRHGQMTYQDVAEILEREMEALSRFMAASMMPKEPDHAKAESLVIEAYRAVVAA